MARGSLARAGSVAAVALVFLAATARQALA
jgi:hypothetical protein